MNLLYLILIGYAGVSMLAALVIYAACVASSRIRRLEEGEPLETEHHEEEQVALARPIKPVV